MVSFGSSTFLSFTSTVTEFPRRFLRSFGALEHSASRCGRYREDVGNAKGGDFPVPHFPRPVRPARLMISPRIRKKCARSIDDIPRPLSDIVMPCVPVQSRPEHVGRRPGRRIIEDDSDDIFPYYSGLALERCSRSQKVSSNMRSHFELRLSIHGVTSLLKTAMR